MTEDEARAYAGKLIDGFILERVAMHYVELTRDGVEPGEIRDRLCTYFDRLHGERARILAGLLLELRKNRDLRPQHETLQ
jgi:hypothetical protein